MKAWPRITALAVRFVSTPRIRLSRAVSRPWSDSNRLFSDPAGVMPRARNQLLDHVRQGRRPVGDDLARVAVKSQGGGEERTRGGDVAKP